MTQLQAIQGQMQAALLADQPLDLSLLRAKSVAQFGVYRVAYRARLRAALRDNYATLPLVMGDDAFDALANAYIDSYPSAHYSLRWFGHQLVEFMQAHAAWVDHPAMVDLAQLEWALRHAFDAASEPPLTAEALAEVPPDAWAGLTLQLQPSVRLLNLQWAVGPIWHALQPTEEPTPELAPPVALAHHVLVWRKGMNTQWKSLTPTDTIFIEALQSGQTFGDVCAALAEEVGPENAAATAVSLLREYLAAGALSAWSRSVSPA